MAEMWYYTTEGKQMDAVTIKELMRLVGDGTLKPTDMVWKDGMPRWIRASSVRELFPDPMSALDPYFTSTQDVERKEAQAKASSVTVASKIATATPLPASGTNGTMPPAAAETGTKKRRPTASDDDRPARRPRETGGGSSIMIIMALVIGGFLLLGALGVGVVILVFVIPRDEKIVNFDKDKKDGGLDGNPQPIKDGKEEPPNLGPLPKDVDEGKGVKTSPQAIRPNNFFDRKFRVRAGHPVSFNVSIIGAGAHRFKLNVVRDKDQNFELIADPQTSDHPSVNWVAANTEIVLVRVQNVGQTNNKVQITYNVSP
jgi:hypothetical protein